MNLNPKEEAVLNMIEEDTSYENYFFNKVVNVKWFYPLKERGYFSPEKAPRVKPTEKGGSYIPRWDVLPYLERISDQLNIQENEKYIDELLDIIREVSKYKNTNGQPIDNYRTWYSFVKILSNIPNNKIPEDIIDLIPTWLNSKFDTTLPGREIIRTLLPKFLTNDPEDIKKAERIIKFITDLKISFLDNDDKEFRLKIEYHYLKEGFEKYSEDIGKKCSEKVIRDLETKIKKVITKKEQGTYHSFYEDLEYLDKPIDMYTSILKKILISKAKNDTNTTKRILEEYFKDVYLYFPKMALFIVGNVFDKYRDFFWGILNLDVENVIFRNSDDFGDELKHVLENLKELTKNQQDILINKIDDSAKSEDFRENRELMLNLHKQKFYKALSFDKYFNEHYKKLKDITKYEIELRPMIGKVDFGPVPNISPLSKEEIFLMSNQELAKFLSNYKGEKHWIGASVNGLSRTLEEVAKENPRKFTDAMMPFLKTDYIYVYDIILGIRNAWEDKKILEWNNLLKYIKDYITSEDFWKDKYVNKNDYHSANHFWVLGIIGELFKKGIINDSKHFSEDNYPLAQEIIFMILDKLLIDQKDLIDSQAERKNYVAYSLNSTFGKITEALLILAYRIKKSEIKVSNKLKEIGWDHGIKNKYEELLGRKILGSYVWLGMYLTIFYILLDKEWTVNKINTIYLEKEKIWEAFMQGYLYSNKINKDIYKIMKMHYKKAIDYRFKEDIFSKRLVQNICYMYLEGFEDINNKDDLFRTILDKWDKTQVKEITGWFWMQRTYIVGQTDKKENPKEQARVETIRKKILDFWEWIYEKKFKEKARFGNLDDKDKEILSEISKLAVFIKKINDDNYELLKISAPYLSVDFNASFFLEYLDDLKDKDENSAGYVGRLFIEILTKSTPDYDQKNIRSIVEYLFEKGYTKNARKICSIYGSSGREFLRDIYEKYNNHLN